MTQGDLFTAPRLLCDTPRSRARDPESSHLAADEVKASGRLACQQQTVLQAIQRWPGSTSAELAHQINAGAPDPIGATYHMVARRAPELVPVHVRRGDTLRACSITGKTVSVWWPV